MMKNAHPAARLFLLMTAALLTLACVPKSAVNSHGNLEAVLKERTAKLEAAFRSGDAEALAELYATNARLAPDGENFITGREAIKQFWTNDFKESKVIKMTTKPLSIEGDENIIYETGLTTSEIIYKNRTYRPQVKYVNIWRRGTDGVFRLEVDFWNGVPTK